MGGDLLQHLWERLTDGVIAKHGPRRRDVVLSGYNRGMSYTAAIDGLLAKGGELSGTRRKFELEHMRALAHALGDPQSEFPSVLIAGTNGKGSTAVTLASILTASGYRTGLYTSPHLLRVNERIQISRPSGSEVAPALTELDDATFTRLYFHVDDAATALVRDGVLPQAPSFFETVTALAFCAFAEAEIDIAILEVGLGGRLDATNIVEPLVSVITDIALDHTEWLGPTITDIAREKAGILRQNGMLITLPQHPEANAAIGERAMALDVTGINAAAYLPQPSPRAATGNTYLVPAFDTELEIEPRLPGDHQRRNLALALASAEFLQVHAGFDRITAESVQRGVQQVRWPGRLERSRTPGGAKVLLDVAHNPAGVWTLRSYLSRAFDQDSPADQQLPSPRTLIFSALADKALEEMAQILFPLFDEPGDRILLAPINNPRASSPEHLQTLAQKMQPGSEAPIGVLNSVEEAWQQVAAMSHGTVVVAGSVYLVAEWKALPQSGAQSGDSR